MVCLDRERKNLGGGARHDGPDSPVVGQAHDILTTLGKPIKENISAIEEVLIQTKAKDQMDVLDLPIRSSAKLAALAGTVASADMPPTRIIPLVQKQESQD